MSQYNTQAEPRSGSSSSYDMKPDPTPYELVVMENDDLRARLQLADERAFEQAATIARLRATLTCLRVEASHYLHGAGDNAQFLENELFNSGHALGISTRKS